MKNTPGPNTLSKFSHTNDVISLSSSPDKRSASLFKRAFTTSILLPFIMAWSCLCTNSCSWFFSWLYLLKNLNSLSLRGVPDTFCCASSSFTMMLPLSSTKGNTLSSSIKILAMRTESNDPENPNLPCTTSHESNFLNSLSFSTFRYNFRPSRVDMLEVPSIL